MNCIYNAIPHKRPRRKDRKKKSKALKQERLLKLAKKLNKNLPKSEKWFQEQYKLYKHIDDKFNEPFDCFIPDVINKTYKYIIEIDGSIHNLPHIQRRDNKKTRKFNLLGYYVIRIKAFDLNSFKLGMERVCKRRPNYSPARQLSAEELKEIAARLIVDPQQGASSGE